jgi:hypothetical protein
MATSSAARSVEAHIRSGDVVRQAGPLDPPALIVPEAVEAASIHLRVASGVGHLPMPEIGGQRVGVDTLVHQLKAAGMAQEMRVNITHIDALGRFQQLPRRSIGSCG